MNAPDLITFEKAAARLHATESDLEELIDAGKLHIRPYLGDVYLDNDEVAALARSRAPKPIQDAHTPPPGVVGWSPVARIRDLKASGIREISGPHAAKLLGVSGNRISQLLREGRLNGEKRGRHRWIDITEVEMYAMDQAHWSGLSGGWSPYGKHEALDPAAGMIQVAEARHESQNDPATQRPESDDYLILRPQAAAILGICVDACRQLCKRQGIGVQRVKRDTGRLNALGKRQVAAPAAYSAREIYALAAKREAQKTRAGFTPKQWRERAVKPFIRTKVEAPPNDILITRAEAATILETSVSNVSSLVANGRLFGWQANPGRSGVPLYLSANQVHRYANDPDRLKRREISLSRSGPRDPSPIGEETEWEIWREETGIADGVDRAKKHTADRDYGEFFNTRQVAKLIGISISAVHFLRQRGRLSAYQKPRQKCDGVGNKWYFYKKDDVYNLLADGEYLLRRDRCRRAKLLSLGREVPSMETEW